MQEQSQIVIKTSSELNHNLCGAFLHEKADNPCVDDLDDKNGGPNHLKAWREFRGLSQAELADAVGTNANMIGYLETGERGLSAKWLRRLSTPLRTSPGFILEHDPRSLPTDIVEIWVNATSEERRQLVRVASAIVKTGTDG